MSEGFLGRWARRKEAVRAAEQTPFPSPLPGRNGGGTEGTASPHPEPPSPPASSPEGGGEATVSEAVALDGHRTASGQEGEAENPLADLPSLDALTPETDLTPFLRAGVPAALRNAALRRMWSLDPSIRDFVSEAREYAYDWNTPGGVPGLGPLLPGDDVKAMLGRLFRDPAQAEDAAAEGKPADPPQADAPLPDSPSAPPEEPRAVAVSAFPAPASDEIAQPSGANAGNVAGTPVESPPARPRLRRHGGAMPA